MSEHTPEPWKGDNCGDYIFDANGEIIAQVRGWGHLEKKLGERGAEAEQIDIQRRIVACVNACRGIEQAQLEDLAEHGIMAVHRSKAERDALRERDEARALVKELAARLKEEEWSGSSMGELDGTCRTCLADSGRETHFEGCELDSLLKRAEALS